MCAFKSESNIDLYSKKKSSLRNIVTLNSQSSKLELTIIFYIDFYSIISSRSLKI